MANFEINISKKLLFSKIYIGFFSAGQPFDEDKLSQKNCYTKGQKCRRLKANRSKTSFPSIEIAPRNAADRSHFFAKQQYRQHLCRYRIEKMITFASESGMNSATANIRYTPTQPKTVLPTCSAKAGQTSYIPCL
ncbi:MAG: hypothetical protein P8M25_03215 [Paracoccaceae bacterium]|nr:hypothetical protein [Paracoccaceae bacterium]